MSRISRNNMGNSSFFHIMVQGINKECIFNTNQNKEKYLKLIYKNNDGVEIIAYCMMDNHAHILVKTDEIENIQRWMKSVNTGYAMYYNTANNRVGYVFRDRYKSQIIKNEKHLYTCVDYIHENPVKACICKKKEEYEFSSYINIYNGNQNEVKRQIAQMFSRGDISINSDEKYQENEFEFLEFSEEDRENRENKEEICKNIIDEFLQTKGIYVEQLNKKEELLIELITILKFQNNISYRLMEKFLGISREKLRRLVKPALKGNN